MNAVTSKVVLVIGNSSDTGFSCMESTVTCTVFDTVFVWATSNFSVTIMTYKYAVFFLLHVTNMKIHVMKLLKILL